jgi:hypothetical protein
MDDDAGSEAVTDVASPPSTPLAPDRPVVDGTAKSSEEIRAEMQQLLDEDSRRAEERREQAGETVGELVTRVEAGSAAPAGLVPAGRDQAARRPGRTGPVSPTGTGQGRIERARAAVPETLAAATGTVQRRPDVFAGLAVVLVAILLVRRWLSRR